MRGITILSILLIFGSHHLLWGQNIYLSISGNVSDAASQRGIENVAVSLLPLDKISYTDETGNFRFDSIPLGRYQLVFSHIGYNRHYVNELDLKAGRPLKLNVFLQGGNQLEEIVVNASNSTANLSILGQQILSLEKTLRFPANFFDPARLATNYPGVTAANDQANALTVRGQSPNQLTWRLQELDIVNPNHTANAGTFNDRVTQSAGGVNILSAQLLDNSTFFKNNYPAGYGNALSGIMDMRLRKGNSNKTNRTVQIGLIGLEAALEGPLKKGSTASYLVNYRYSTVGLLTQLGVDFGGESINYQDLSFHLHFPLKKGELSFFGTGGLSNNRFEPEEDQTLWELEEDFYERDFDSQMGAIGLNFKKQTGTKGIFKLGVALSALSHERMATSIAPEISTNRDIIDKRSQSILSTFIQQQWAYSKSILKVGMRWNAYGDRINLENEDFDTDNSYDEQLFQPYLHFSSAIGNRLTYTIGVHALYTTQSEQVVLEPRVEATFTLSPSQQLTLGYGLFSQIPPIALNTGVGLTNDLELARSHQLSLQHDWVVSNDIRLKSELFYQRLFDLAISRQIGFNFSAVNVLDEIAETLLFSSGPARSYGLELSLEKSFTNEAYFLLTGTLFNSEYQLTDDQWFNTRFNNQYQVNAIYGKEWSKVSKKDKIKTLGLNLRALVRGGFWETPINEVTSAQEGKTVLLESSAFSERLPAFNRIDLRFYYRVNNKKGFNSTLSLDIQNLTSAENPSYRYFDSFTGQVETKLQLGIIPIISYRIEF